MRILVVNVRFNCVCIIRGIFIYTGRRVKVGGNLSATMNYLKVAVGITCQSVFARLSNRYD